MTASRLDINVVAAQGLPGPSSWLAEVADYNSPFSGLFVFGPTFTVARASLAETIWTSVITAPDRHRIAGVDLSAVTELHLLTVTRKAFPVSALGRRARA